MTNSQNYYWPFNNPNMKNAIDAIRWHMDTECQIHANNPTATRGGSTYEYKTPNGIQFAKNNGYPNSQK